MPSAYKEAIATPLIKKANLDPVFSNFRTVSNLPFISKLIERVVSEQIDAFTDQHGLNEPIQSAFKDKHSTETALVKVQNYFFCAFDEQKLVLLALLDLSAAFDTCNHHIFLRGSKENSIYQIRRSIGFDHISPSEDKELR